MGGPGDMQGGGHGGFRGVHIFLQLLLFPDKLLIILDEYAL